ncbi:MAG TPA: hypothetical protein VKW04_18195 [Planctomycetota bacterium]|nr:hypothetical protein [Planctomycetota bacterium]
MDWTGWGTTIVGAGIAGVVGLAVGGPAGALVGVGLAFGWSWLKGAAQDKAAAAGDPSDWLWYLAALLAGFVICGLFIWSIS